MPKTGDKPGPGNYKCATCGKKVQILSPNEELPVCPVCKQKTWKKV